MPDDALDAEAARLHALLPPGRRLAVLGSTSFHHPGTPAFCDELGRRLAWEADLLLLTGGMPGVAVTVARAFDEVTSSRSHCARLVHLLPQGLPPPPTGRTLEAGTTLAQRRALLARLADLYIVVEGGPGTAEEAAIAAARGARILPVGSLGGAGAELHRAGVPPWADAGDWQALGDPAAPPFKLARTVASMAVGALPMPPAGLCSTPEP